MNILRVVCSTWLLLAFSSAFAGENVCKTPFDTGCWKLQITNALYSKDHSAMQGLDMPQAQVSVEEKARRRNELGEVLTKGIISGDVQTAGMRSFTVYVFGSDAVPTAFATNGKKYRNVKEFEDVTTTALVPDTSIGKPSKVYRIKTTGADIAGILSFPRDSLGNVHFLICSDTPTETVYPAHSEKGNAGMWIMPTQVQAALSTGKGGHIVPFVSKK